jgi:putative DNA primase/helicase
MKLVDDAFAEADLSNLRKLAELAGKQELITEDSAALAFAQQYRAELLFDHDAKSWFRWTGNHWQQERTRLAFAWARDLIRDLTENEAIKVKALGRKTAFTSGVERFAQTDRAFAITTADWNRDRYLLATPLGTVELNTGRLRPAKPDDRINKLTAIGPSSTISCPRWLAFLSECTGNDTQVVAFLQRWLGYCLTGDIREHALVFCYGPGGNGKTTLLNTVSAILGDYATPAAMETFVASPFDQHPTDLAMLCGARLVTAAETEEGRAWAETKIKRLTGGDPVTARFMRCNNFTYWPTFKLMVIGNHEPALRNVDDAARRRFNIVPFTRKPAVVDRQLEEKLKPEWPGILRWMIDGCLEWQRIGLAPPETVIAATASYFDNQDLFAQWLEEKCDAEPGNQHKTATSAELFKSWSDYAKAAGDPPGNRKSFARILERHGFKSHRQSHSGTRMWRGVRLKVPEYDDQGRQSP